MKRKTQSAIDSARALESELASLGRDSETLNAREFEELSVASGDLKAAWDDLFPERSELVEILDQQRAEQWWHRKLIATFPIAVVETDLTGRILWANAAWASLVNMRVLQTVRTDIRRYIADEDHDNLEAFLAQMAVVAPMVDELQTTLRVKSTPSVLANIEVSIEVRPEEDHVRHIATWVVEPISEITEQASPDAKIAHVFSRLGLLPLRSRTNQELLNEVVVLSTYICPPDSYVSVIVGDPEQPKAMATSGRVAQVFDAVQLEAGDGPSKEVWAHGVSTLVVEREDEERWQEFWERVPDEELGSLIVAPIRVGDEVLGVLNVYAKAPHAFGREDFKQIEFFAEALGAVLHHVDEERQLRTLAGQLEEAMRSREVIEQAKGVLMAKYACTADEALEKLKKVSQDKNVRVRILAQEIVAAVSGKSTLSRGPSA